MLKHWSCTLLVALLCSASSPFICKALAQDDPPATLTYADGLVEVDQNGTIESAVPPTLILPGDRVRTGSGRAELVLDDGSTVHLDEGTTLEWLGDQRARLLDGRVAFRAAGGGWTLDTAAGAIRLHSRGEYDIRVDSARVLLSASVARGDLEVLTDTEQATLRSGETAAVGLGGRITRRAYNAAAFDGFSRWAYDRAYLGPRGGRQYLPPELRAYGPTLDQFGRWDYDATYGNVWFPTVAVGWRPYAHGHWRHTRYGWTWYGIDRWASPTHYYGRWGLRGSSWFWIPARVWGPAWVSWGFGAGLIAWSPLGWNGRPVVDFWARDAYRPHAPWGAWTAVPRDRFANRGPLPSWHADLRRFSDRDRREFVLQASGPPAPGGHADPRAALGAVGAVPRSWERAVPRGDAGDRYGAARSPRQPNTPSAPGSPPVAGPTTPVQTRSTTPTVLGPPADDRNDQRGGFARERAGDRRDQREAAPPQSWEGERARPRQSWESAPRDNSRGADSSPAAPGRRRDEGAARGTDTRGGDARGGVRNPNAGGDRTGNGGGRSQEGASSRGGESSGQGAANGGAVRRPR